MTNRRIFLETSASLMWLGSKVRTLASDAPSEGFDLRLKETAGIRRFGYPVATVLPEGASSADYRLLKDGREIEAQFRRVTGPDGRPVVTLDFNASPGPFEVENYRVSPAVPSPAKPARRPEKGLQVGISDGTARVSNAPYLTYTLAENLAGFLQSVQTPYAEFLKPQSMGLFVGSAGQRIPLGGKVSSGGKSRSVRVTRQGPLAVGLEFESEVSAGASAPLASRLVMTFPNSKSWIEAAWRVADPENRIESLGLDLQFQLQGSPILVDCGADSTVYTTLDGRERVDFESGPDTAWAIHKGTGDPLPLEASAGSAPGKRPEGWVHIMDRNRCTAMAVADFGGPDRRTHDRFEIDGGGRLRFERRFLRSKTDPNPRGQEAKTLKLWLHFVPMPVQIGAKTSPQAMLAPLEVAWDSTK